MFIYIRKLFIIFNAQRRQNYARFWPLVAHPDDAQCWRWGDIMSVHAHRLHCNCPIQMLRITGSIAHSCIYEPRRMPYFYSSRARNPNLIVRMTQHDLSLEYIHYTREHEYSHCMQLSKRQNWRTSSHSMPDLQCCSIDNHNRYASSLPNFLFCILDTRRSFWARRLCSVYL